MTDLSRSFGCREIVQVSNARSKRPFGGDERTKAEDGDGEPACRRGSVGDRHKSLLTWYFA